MGVYSEMDLDLRCGDTFSEGDGGSPAFSDEGCSPALAEKIPTDAQTPQTFISSGAGAEANQRLQEDAAPPASTNSERENGAADTPDSGRPPDKEAAPVESEDAKRKAHEESEAKRRAKFDARQAAKKAAGQKQLAKLEAMNGEELLAASMKRVSADTEKLTRRNMKECVAEHIQTMCIEDPRLCPEGDAPPQEHGPLLPVYQPERLGLCAGRAEGQRHPARPGAAGVWV